MNIETLQENYNTLKNIIETYVSKRKNEINRLNLRKERLIEDRDTLPSDFSTRDDVIENYNSSSRQDIINDYNYQISQVDKEIQKLLNPSREEMSDILDELTEHNQQISSEKRNIDAEISNLKRVIKRLQFNISEWHYEKKPLDSEYYNLINELEKINYNKLKLENLIKEYEKLEADLDDYENEIFKTSTEKINDILNNRFEQDTKEQPIEDIIENTVDNKIEDPIENQNEENFSTQNLDDTYEQKLEEYKTLSGIYNEDLERLYELQAKYENEEIEYSEYEKYADYMVERYNFIVETYINLMQSEPKEENEFTGLTDEELEKKLKDLDKVAEEIYHQQVHVENGENPDDSLYIINNKIRLIKEELKQRKEPKIREIPTEPIQPMMILKPKKKVIPVIEPTDKYTKYLDEYKKLLEIYNEDLERLYELQAKYENGEIEYSEYEKYANYMVERYRFINEVYNKLLELCKNEENDFSKLTDEELESQLKELESQIEEIYHQQVHVENEENPDDSLAILNEKIKLIKDELESRKKIKERELPEEPLQPTMILEKENEPIPPVPPVEEQNFYTLEGIIAKVIGDEEISKSQSKRYMASQIKVYNKLPKNNWGNAYKLVSIPKKILSVIMIPFNGVKKLLGKLTTTANTKQAVSIMKKRISELSDEELEIFLNEYKGSTALGFRLPKLFNELMSERIVSYLQNKISKINNRIAELLVEIDYTKKLIDDIYEKINNGNISEEERNKYIELYHKANEKCSSEIKELTKLQKEGNNLVEGSGLHSLEEELKASNSKMNYKGGRFSSNREIDDKLWKILGPTSKIIEYSNNPEEVVNAYFKQKELYLENTKEKRSIRNLGSKVTAGKLDYRPFVEIPYYGNDPYISDLISSILMVSTAGALANTIFTNIQNAKVNQAIQNANQNITNNNAQIGDYNSLRKNVTDGGETIVNDTIYGINRNPNDVLNLGERGNNDFYNYKFTQSHQAEDALIHADATQLDVYNKQVISDLTSQYNSGTIEMPEYIRKLTELKTYNNNFYNNYLTKYEPTFTSYSASHPQYDYQVIFEALKNIQNTNSAEAMSNYLNNIYEQAYNMIDLNNIPLIQQVVESASLIPPIIATSAAVVKTTHESQKVVNSTEWDKEGKFAELLERIKNRELENDEELDILLDNPEEKNIRTL